jgi:hypothetical protein
MISGGVNTKRSLEFSRLAKDAGPEPGRRRGRFRLIRGVEGLLGAGDFFVPLRLIQTTISRPLPGKIALPNDLLSVVSTPLPSLSYLTENTRQNQIYKVFIFNELRTAMSYISRKPCRLNILQIGYRGVRRSARKRAKKGGGPGVRAASSSVFTLEHAQPVGVGLGVSVTCSVKPTRARKVARSSAGVSMIEFAPSFSGASQ